MGSTRDKFATLERADGRAIFGADAEGYHQSRPGYPAALFDHLRTRVGSRPDILELGAGTGLASTELLKFEPRRMTIVEPDPELCKFLTDRLPGDVVQVIEGAFPDVVVDGPFNLIACAAAFHWMEPEVALAQIHTLLAPGGTWAMWWNSYFGNGEATAFLTRIEQLLRDEGVPLPPSYVDGKHYSLDRDLHERRLVKAGFGNLDHLTYRTRMSLNPQQARDLFATFSFIRLLDGERKSRILDQIAKITETDFGANAETVMVTAIYLGDRD